MFHAFSSAFLLICIFFRITIGKNIDDLVVELTEPKGKIIGHALESAKGREYYAFQEIPYGKPPVGENRFMPPIAHDGWDGILNCTRNTKICYQFRFPELSIGSSQEKSKQTLKENEIEESEDCLYVNVYTPVKPGTNHSLSVFFFIHGGAFTQGDGTSSSYGPKYLIDGDVVIVTMNYRVGPFGFLSTGDNEISGNMGLKDQHLALQWTYKNIHLFGGNPRDIVLGGESAGSFSAGYHLLSPRTKGLVSGFIQQSGSHIGVGAFSSQPRYYAFKLGEALNATVSDNTSSLVDALKKASAEEIVNANDLVASPAPLGFIVSITWEPVVEDITSSEAFITSPMYEEMMKGNFNRVPCLIGFNSEESLWFMPSNESVFEKAAALFDANPSMLINSAINVDNRSLVGEELKKTYTSSSFQEDLKSFIRFTSDTVFVRASIRQAELMSQHIPVYLYQLSAANNMNDKYPGVAHVLDMTYLWEMPSLPLDMSTVDEEYREIMLSLWWNFIKYKNPAPEKDVVTQNIEWPVVEPENIRYINLNYSISIETNPRNYDNVRNVLLKYMEPPYYVF